MVIWVILAHAHAVVVNECNRLGPILRGMFGIVSAMDSH